MSGRYLCLMSRLYYTEILVYQCYFSLLHGDREDPCASVYNSADRPTLQYDYKNNIALGAR